MKYYCLESGLPYTEKPPFPLALPTRAITLHDLMAVKAFSQKKDGPVEIEIGYSAYKSLGPIKGDDLAFTLMQMPHRTDCVGGEWVEREVGTTEWMAAEFEDATLWDSEGKIASIRYRRALEPTQEASCLTDRELLEDIHAMLKQLTQQ